MLGPGGFGGSPPNVGRAPKAITSILGGNESISENEGLEVAKFILGLEVANFGR